jgi:hypothetical protein
MCPVHLDLHNKAVAAVKAPGSIAQDSMAAPMAAGPSAPQQPAAPKAAVKADAPKGPPPPMPSAQATPEGSPLNLQWGEQLAKAKAQQAEQAQHAVPASKAGLSHTAAVDVGPCLFGGSGRGLSCLWLQ